MTCPVHVFGRFLKKIGSGRKVFAEFTAGGALSTLREILERMQVVNADKYRTHDLRRGHALDLQRSGEVVVVVACEWLLVYEQEHH